MRHALILAAVLSAPVGAADSYPARPVTFIVPFAPGAVTDIETRLYAQKLGEATGRTAVAKYCVSPKQLVGTP